MYSYELVTNLYSDKKVLVSQLQIVLPTMWLVVGNSLVRSTNQLNEACGVTRHSLPASVKEAVGSLDTLFLPVLASTIVAYMYSQTRDLVWLFQ